MNTVDGAPAAWLEKYRGYHTKNAEHGGSGATTLRLSSKDAPDLILKRLAREVAPSLSDEAQRLRWLKDQHVPCPQVVDYYVDDRHEWMLLSVLAGHALSQGGLPAPQAVRCAVEALHSLHRLEIASCPFDNRLARRLTNATTRVRAGHVDESDFDVVRRGRRADDILAELMRARPNGEDLVVAHGDATFDNIMVNDEGFVGVLDVGSLGVADRWADVALVVRDLERRFDAKFTTLFLDHIGIAANTSKQHYYQLLDELF